MFVRVSECGNWFARFDEIVADQNASNTFGVVRLFPNGTLDPNFGMGGSTPLAFGNFGSTPNAAYRF